MPKPSFPRLPELTEEQMPLTWPPWGDRMMDQRSDDIRALVAKEYSPDPPQERSIKEAQLVGGWPDRCNMSTLVRSMEYSSIESCRILGCLWLLTINQTFKIHQNPANHSFFFPQWNIRHCWVPLCYQFEPSPILVIYILVAVAFIPILLISQLFWCLLPLWVIIYIDIASLEVPKLLLLVAFLALGLVLIFWHSSMPAESLSAAGAVISASTSGAEDALRSAEPQQRNDGVIIYAYQQPGWMSDFR